MTLMPAHAEKKKILNIGDTLPAVREALLTNAFNAAVLDYSLKKSVD
jgi:hypothetical protein